MILVQKPQAFSLSQPAIHHRRHPSAPVVVQPTRTPGLLSLSKPARSSPQSRIQSLHQHQQRIRSTPKPKSAPRTTPQPPAATAAENADPRPLSDKNKVSESATPEKIHPRGRQNAKAHNKYMTRSASHSTTRGRRKPNRQPSPPLEVTQPPSSQAEGPSMPTQPYSDPFLVQPPNLKSSPFPILSPRPSGKLARRRQQQQQQQQQQQKPANKIQHVSPRPVPVPSITKRSHHQQMSRSEPHASHMPQSITAKIQPQIRAPKWDAFPICDDMTDAGDMTDSGHPVPVTPTRPHSKATRPAPFNTTPLRSAPLHGSFFQTMNTPSPPQPNGGGRRHRRTPSDGVFSMSSDEDHSTSLSTPSTNGPLTPTVQPLRVSRPRRRVSIGGSLPPYGASSITFNAGSSSLVSTPLASPQKQHATTVPRTRESREKQLEREAAAAYFASSNFQNSPNPEELPPPLFA